MSSISMTPTIPKSEPRSPDLIREHYLIEKGLAERLRHASREERKALYTALYDELYRRVPAHPQLTRKADPAAQARAVAGRMTVLRRFLHRDAIFLEVGPGDCALALEVARLVRQVYAVDVSEEIGKGLRLPPNFERVISDGCSIPVAEESVHVAYSDQLIEHLHPEDALEQLRNIHRTLVAGGVYICITPNSLSGPHDISGYFDEVATGFHLREYTVTELARIFRDTGFRKVRVLVGARGFQLALPVGLVSGTERALRVLPHRLRKRVAGELPLRLILGISLVATK
jgi:SAM-dependent methyltransferase